ncbi:MAG: hypothetical protein RL678_1007 [Pseudomonadota bacterium]|jgi:hypothetical protein
MKTAELTGAALDWAVTKCEGRDIVLLDGEIVWRDEMRYCTDWALGGAIIERERISITPDVGCWNAHYHDNLFEEDGSDCFQIGTTPLIAAMRCYVASKLGDEIELPEELMTAA